MPTAEKTAFLSSPSAASMGIEKLIVTRLINKYIRLLPKFDALIQSSFLTVDLKEKFAGLLRERMGRLSP